jgi:hypothetical protein
VLKLFPPISINSTCLLTDQERQGEGGGGGGQIDGRMRKFGLANSIYTFLEHNCEKNQGVPVFE